MIGGSAESRAFPSTPLPERLLHFHHGPVAAPYQLRRCLPLVSCALRGIRCFLAGVSVTACATGTFTSPVADASQNRREHRATLVAERRTRARLGLTLAHTRGAGRRGIAARVLAEAPFSRNPT
jgi:hypothetical protein